MEVYRLISRRYSLDSEIISGEGAKLYPGRWNHRGTPVVYTAESRSLAVLEILVHLDVEEFPDNFVIVPIEIPDDLDITRYEVRNLEKQWNAYPFTGYTQDSGHMWVIKKETAVLSVPSAIVPDERIYILNPLHPDFSKIKVGQWERFVFDERLYKNRA